MMMGLASLCRAGMAVVFGLGMPWGACDAARSDASSQASAALEVTDAGPASGALRFVVPARAFGPRYGLRVVPLPLPALEPEPWDRVPGAEAPWQSVTVAPAKVARVCPAAVRVIVIAERSADTLAIMQVGDDSQIVHQGEELTVGGERFMVTAIVSGAVLLRAGDELVRCARNTN